MADRDTDPMLAGFAQGFGVRAGQLLPDHNTADVTILVREALACIEEILSRQTLEAYHAGRVDQQAGVLCLCPTCSTADATKH